MQIDLDASIFFSKLVENAAVTAARVEAEPASYILVGILFIHN